MRQYRLLAACVLLPLFCACGGGGGASSGTAGVVPENPHMPGPSSPTSSPSAPPPIQNSAAHIPNTLGRIGLVQVFDYHNGYMPASKIQSIGQHYDAVWASLSPGEWDNAHRGMVVSDYYIMGMDQYSVTHHGLSWWQSNHPDWIFYACTASGAPTHDIAYMQGINVPDMPIDIHNRDAVAYQVSTMAAYAKSAGYNALALDQVVFWNIYTGGNRAFGERHNDTEYGCGGWHGSTFVRDYTGPQDPHYAADVIAYVKQARSILHSMGMVLVINHPGGSIKDPNEQQLLANTDAVMNETGFSDYGRYTKNPNIVAATLSWMQYAQTHGAAVFIVDKFINISGESVTGPPLEYSIATYLLGNEGDALLFVGALHGYGTLQYHSEYGAAIGKPCSDYSGGPQVFMRRFHGGMVVVNNGTSAAPLALPSGKAYRDIDGHSVGSAIPPMSGYVLLTSSDGCS